MHKLYHHYSIYSTLLKICPLKLQNTILYICFNIVVPQAGDKFDLERSRFNGTTWKVKVIEKVLS